MRLRMLSVTLLGLTAVATGWQQFYNLMWAIWGAPTSPIQYVGLFGSALLGLAALVAFVHLRAAHLLATFAVAVIWVFYAPALCGSIWQLMTGSAYASVELVLFFIPPFFLTMLTVFLVRDLRLHKVDVNTATGHTA